MAWWYIPAAMAAAGALKGGQDAKTAQSDARDKRNLYAAMARANLGANIPGGGFVGTPPSQGEGMFAGALGGAQSGLQTAGMAKGLGLFDSDSSGGGSSLPYGEQGNMSADAYNNPYANTMFIGPPTKKQSS